MTRCCSRAAPVSFPTFTSGWGDGFYASYSGLDGDGNPIALVTDFAIMTEAIEKRGVVEVPRTPGIIDAPELAELGVTLEITKASASETRTSRIPRAERARDHALHPAPRASRRDERHRDERWIRPPCARGAVCLVAREDGA